MKCNNILIFVILVFVGCTKTHVKDSLLRTPRINQPATATVLSINVKDKIYAKCVQKELENYISILKLIPEDNFREALFPWFELSTCPKSVEELASIMDNHLVQDRIRSIGLRFIIFVGGHESKEEFHGPFLFGADIHGVVFLGYTSSERKNEISAVIWDINEMVSLGDVQVEKSGRWGN